jgi:hypothetical protein
VLLHFPTVVHLGERPRNLPFTGPGVANKMRPLTEDESKAVFEKLANYIVSRYQLLQSYSDIYRGKGKKPRASGRQTRRSSLLSLAQGSRLLCF